MEGCDGEGRCPYHIPKELQIARNASHNGQPEAALPFYANSEPQPNAKYSCAAGVAIAR
ncbi:MAG: hypothetical protein SOT60_07050 [Bilifractor sp.]|nr:hypothetical protein [Lachnospiraceae bacterium]MDY2837675.1 hypothetical protein [Bilifractor sp.]